MKPGGIRPLRKLKENDIKFKLALNGDPKVTGLTDGLSNVDSQNHPRSKSRQRAEITTSQSRVRDKEGLTSKAEDNENSQ